MPARLSDEAKRLRGTRHARPAPASIGTPRLSRPIAAPKDMTPELRQQWKTHMVMCVATGRMAAADLLAFMELCRAAHMVETAYNAAIEEGPTVAAENGTKTSPAWRAYAIASANYQRWLAAFGLTPKARQAIRQLPTLASDLHLVGDDDE
jgi:P27 family predicted phage terminase small subunit